MDEPSHNDDPQQSVSRFYECLLDMAIVFGCLFVLMYSIIWMGLWCRDCCGSSRYDNHHDDNDGDTTVESQSDADESITSIM